MTGIAGFVHFDYTPVSDEDVRTLIRSLKRDDKVCRTWTDGPAAMLTFGPAAGLEGERTGIDQGRCLMLDGRVDGFAGEPSSPTEAPPDLSMLLGHYDGDAADFLNRLLGDFSLSLWDSGARRLVLARDIVGLRPLYYTKQREFLAWASQIPVLLRLPGVSREPDRRQVASFLTGVFDDGGRTLFREVKQVKPAHLVRVTPAGIDSVPYWNPAEVSEVTHRPSETVERFTSLLDEAVRLRARDDSQTGLLLSGGVDSSAVASSLLSTGHAGSLTAFHLSFPESASDESKTAGRFASESGLKLVTIPAVVPDREELVREIEAAADLPDYPNGLAYGRLLSQARESGVGTMLSGFGGDDWFGGSRYLYADLLQARHVAQIATRLRRDCRRSGVRATFRTLLYFGLFPLLPVGLKTVVRQSVTTRHPRRERYPRWVRRDFLSGVGPPYLAPPDTRPGRDFRHRELASWILHPRLARAAELQHRAFSRLGITPRYPFHDRRLIEFSLSLSWRFFPPDGPAKPLQLQHIQRCFPKLGPNFFRDPEGSAIFVQALQSYRADDLFQNLAIAREGWVRSADALAGLQAVQASFKAQSRRYALEVTPLWHVLAVELWYRRCILGNGTTGS